jgi:hypothetical protein
MRGEEKGEEKPKVNYSYLYCRRCKIYFTLDSYVHDCPFCAQHGHNFFLAVVTRDEPVRDRLFIPLKKCINCADVHRCPECFGIPKEKRQDHCRICSCAGCCNENIEFADDIRNGKISLSQVFKDMVAKNGIKPGPMAKVIEQEFEDEIPF